VNQSRVPTLGPFGFPLPLEVCLFLECILGSLVGFSGDDRDSSGIGVSQLVYHRANQAEVNVWGSEGEGWYLLYHKGDWNAGSAGGLARFC
jgi:hypothetical protein